jgi:hypothetical protein
MLILVLASTASRALGVRTTIIRFSIRGDVVIAWQNGCIAGQLQVSVIRQLHPHAKGKDRPRDDVDDKPLPGSGACRVEKLGAVARPELMKPVSIGGETWYFSPVGGNGSTNAATLLRAILHSPA